MDLNQYLERMNTTTAVIWIHWAPILTAAVTTARTAAVAVVAKDTAVTPTVAVVAKDTAVTPTAKDRWVTLITAERADIITAAAMNTSAA